MAAKKMRGLGRGLSSLIGTDDIELTRQVGKEDRIQQISIDKLQAGRYQPRQDMTTEGLEELAASIREQGVINPIVARSVGKDRFEIIAGERRFRASRMAGLTTVPVIVRSVNDKAALAMALIENMQREDLNVVEEAIGTRRLIDEFGYTHEEAAKALGKSRSATTNLLRLLNLAKPVQEMLAQRKLEMGHARALLTLGIDDQIEAANRIVKQSLSVRQAEQLAETLKTKKTAPRKSVKQKKNQDVQRLERELSETLAAPVSIESGRGQSGKIVIAYADLDDMDAILNKLLPNREQ